MKEPIGITVILKDGGYAVVKIPTELIGDLAVSIKKNGFEWVALQSGPIAVAGFMVTGNQVGDRVIILGGKSE